MVEKISAELQRNIRKTVEAAETRTDAEIAVSVFPASDGYLPHLILSGLLLGSIAAFCLWIKNPAVGFPLLFLLQLCGISAVTLIPFLRHLFLKLLPGKTLHQHAAQKAHAEFIHALHHAEKEKPCMLLYVSLAEKYVHILHNHVVTAKIPNEAWEPVIKTFGADMRAQGLGAALDAAIPCIAGILELHFPRKS